MATAAWERLADAGPAAVILVGAALGLQQFDCPRSGLGAQAPGAAPLGMLPR